jgi:hypothetical protein
MPAVTTSTTIARMEVTVRTHTTIAESTTRFVVMHICLASWDMLPTGIGVVVILLTMGCAIDLSLVSMVDLPMRHKTAIVCLVRVFGVVLVADARSHSMCLP